MMTRAERLVMEMRCCDPDGNREALTVGEARALFSDLAVMDAENERLRGEVKRLSLVVDSLQQEMGEER